MYQHVNLHLLDHVKSICPLNDINFSYVICEKSSRQTEFPQHSDCYETKSSPSFPPTQLVIREKTLQDPLKSRAAVNLAHIRYAL